MNAFFDILRQYTELAIFLTLDLVFTLGYIRIGSYRFGAVPGTLFTGLLIGQIGDR